jgi:type II restriction/modification system DNA methylase subunit YeeA
MNTSSLKRFAKEARIKLLDIVGRKLEYVLANKSASFIDTYKTQLESLRKQIIQHGQPQVIETVAYTWFNRIMALRFMDANGYLNPKVVTPAQGNTVPEILQEAKAGNVDMQLQLDRKRLNDLLDGKTVVTDAQTEAYKLLLIASCNYWNVSMPFMFERINDYTELLLPDDLLSDFSIVSDIRNGMSNEDCQQEELIGWLYQFYIADKKDKVINAKKKYKTEELPEATQLFTPHWMVKYIVDNTLGRMWLEVRPDSNLKNHLEFYVEPSDKENIPSRDIKSPEEIKFLDPAFGSAHILVYTFEIFTKIYEEEGYNVADIPNLIIEKNLFGLEIDERAASIGRFALNMKATAYRKRYLRSPIIPKMYVFEESEEISKFKNVKAIGSLVRINQDDLEKIKIDDNSIFTDRQKQLKEICVVLSQKCDCVVTNPPYVNAAYMNEVLSDFVRDNYYETKSDLFACFLIRCREFAKPDGMIGFVCPFVWMFIARHVTLRDIIINETTIQNLIQLEYNAFEPACVPICTFTLRNNFIPVRGDYIKLSEFRGYESQPTKTLEAIKNTALNYRFSADQNNFKKVSGYPIAYWVSNILLEPFKNGTEIGSIASPRQGMATSDNGRFLRLWYEVSQNNIKYDANNRQEAITSGKKWFPYNKGGSYRKWYGNNDFVVNWSNDGKELLEFAALLYGSPTRTIKNIQHYFKPSITWSALSSGALSVRYNPAGFLFDTKGQCVFSEEDNLKEKLIAFLNSKPAFKMLEFLAPTLDFNSGVIAKLPYIPSVRLNLDTVTEIISISKADWDSFETSWDFSTTPLLLPKFQNSSIQDSYIKLREYWKNILLRMEQLEEEINANIISDYKLNDEINPSVSINEITLSCNPNYRYGTNKPIKEQELLLVSDTFREFISYSIGCTLGRYSLNVEGLILANQGESLQDYLKQVPNPTFLPDEDNIIPFLEGEYFTDDVVGRFKEFLKVSFGEKHFEENLRYIEETIGKDIRKYFIKDFYSDHIKRYRKRPIYWMFSSPKGSFKALIYMHRYRADTVSKLLNDYLRTYIAKLESEKQNFTQATISESASAREKIQAEKRITAIESVQKELKEYERTLYELATQKIEIDLDDGVKVNYQKFKSVLVPIKGLEKEEE